MQKNYFVLRGVTWFISVFHVIFGIVLNTSPKTIVWFVTNVLGATKMPESSVLFLARALGTYMIAFGIGMGIAAWNPIKNRALLTVGAILVGLRAIQRIIQAADLEQMLGISSGKNLLTIGILFVLAAILIYFRMKLYQDMKNAA
jgi:hypothetical protein